MSYIYYYTPVPITISSKQKKWTVKKQLYSRKVPYFLAFVAIKRQYFELLVQEIKCRRSNADLCAQIYANMLIHPVVLVSLENSHNNANMTKGRVALDQFQIFVLFFGAKSLTKFRCSNLWKQPDDLHYVNQRPHGELFFIASEAKTWIELIWFFWVWDFRWIFKFRLNKLNCTFDVDVTLSAGYSSRRCCFQKTQILVPQ